MDMEERMLYSLTFWYLECTYGLTNLTISHQGGLRYWEKRNNIQVSWEERVCLNCFKKGFKETETEEHFLLRCLHPDLKVHRENLLLKACTVLPSFNYLNDTDKLVFLLSNCDIIFFSAKTCSKMLNIRTDVSRTDFI